MDLSNDKNTIDKTDYPQTAEIEICCADILTNPRNARDAANTVDISTTGSSEAGMPGGSIASAQS